MVNRNNMRNIVNKKLTTILSELNIETNNLEFSDLTELSLISKLRNNLPILFPDESFDLIKSNSNEKIGTVHINYKFSCAKVTTKLIGSDKLSKQDKFDNYTIQLAFPYSLLQND